MRDAIHHVVNTVRKVSLEAITCMDIGYSADRRLH